MKKEVIEELVKKRARLLKKEDYDSKSKTGKEIDEIEDFIRKEFIEDFKGYEVDYILETLTKFGSAPNLIYDDNGFFAITEDGYQQVVIGSQKIEGNFTVYVEKKQWKKTIREALYYHLTYND